MPCLSKLVLSVATLVISSASVANAIPLTFYLQGIAFDDGGTAMGSFLYDPATNVYSLVNVATTPGTVRTVAANYRFVLPSPAPSFSFAKLVTSNQADLTGTPFFQLTFVPTLTDAGTYSLFVNNSLEGTCANPACTTNAGPFRHVTAGTTGSSISLLSFFFECCIAGGGLPGVGPNCSDGIQNGTETDVDCGGTCGACANGRTCLASSDCVSGVCTASVCVAAAPTCNDGIKNGTETDVDCGGGICPACATGKTCKVSGDCATGACNAGVCAPSACMAPNTVCGANCVNLQTSVTNCGACGQACSTANIAATCSAGLCAGTCNLGFANCDANFSNGCETNINTDSQNCGACGKVCKISETCTNGACVGAPTCNDGIKNGTETDVDCGGGICPACATGKTCKVSGDCASGACNAGVCAPSACMAPNTVCGANCVNLQTSVTNCGACGQACSTANIAATCSAGLCAGTCNLGFANCDANFSNGCETNINTDSQNCGACGKVCKISETCTNGACVGAPTCNDGIKNGTETDVDCGGGICPACATGKTCKVSGDCASGACNAGVCAPSACMAPNTVCGANCVNLQTSVTNCGACGQACSTANIAATCSAGLCAGTCNLGFANCDANFSNGCETNINTDSQNCGACGKVCKISETCTNGACVGAPTCNDGIKNGTETDVDCGGGICPACATGKTCKVSGDCASGACNAGVCAPSACMAPNTVCGANCVNLQTSVTNCGACGQACSTANITATCSAGLCGGTCNPGFANCDANFSNGCETNISADNQNCGACGKVCKISETCTNGACVGAPTCNDGIKNGTETDVDCGGGICPACATGKTCKVSGDCASGNCAGGVCK